MNLDDAVVLETFSNRIEAEMAAGLLESEGIEAMVMADDAGGTYPMLQFIRGVRLMVFKEDEARAREILLAEEMDKLVDMERVGAEAIQRVEQMGIVFVDEIDKIASRQNVGGLDVSREGVQRDLLPIVEGSKVNTRYGIVDTAHILFIAAGAFHMSKPSDLIPELQGRFPIRVELASLSVSDFEKILTATDACLTRQYAALPATEQVHLEFREDGIRRLAEIAFAVNERQENIGARRLHTVMERLLDDVSFHAARRTGEHIAIDAEFVDATLAGIAGDDNLARYIL